MRAPFLLRGMLATFGTVRLQTALRLEPSFAGIKVNVAIPGASELARVAQISILIGSRRAELCSEVGEVAVRVTSQPALEADHRGRAGGYLPTEAALPMIALRVLLWPQRFNAHAEGHS